MRHAGTDVGRNVALCAYGGVADLTWVERERERGESRDLCIIAALEWGSFILIANRCNCQS